MLYNIQFICYGRDGSVIRIGDLLPLGIHGKFPVRFIMNTIHSYTSDLDSLNLACGLLPTTIESNKYYVMILVLSESSDPVCFSQLYIPKVI